MANEEIIRAGIAAAKAGNIDQATALFAQAVKADPGSELGWLWLGKYISDKSQKEFCYRRVLKINPGNLEAAEGLAELTKPKPAPPVQPVAPKPASLAPVFSQPPPPQESPKTVSPFFFDDNFEEVPSEPAAQEINFNSPPREPSSELPPLPPLPEAKPAATAMESGEESEPTPKKKKTNGCLVAFTWIVLIVLVIGAGGAGYLYSTGKLAQYLPIGPVATWTLAKLPTQNATQLAVKVPTRTLQVRLTPTEATATTVPTPKATIAYTPIFEDSPCKFVKPIGVVVNCGYVTVPEDRTDPKSKSIQLAVVVFHSTSDNPAPEPVVFLQGGPGGEAVMLSADAYSILVEPFLSKRDYIAFDQRGTGLSIPALGCDELETVYKQDIRGQVPASGRDMIYTNAFRSCHGMMTIGGIDLNAYNTVNSAADLKDIVTALGYKQVDLYGASYGTRLALVTMRDYPSIVHSVVLDSVVPVEAKLFDEDPVRYGSAIQAMFDGCAADPQCNSAFPNLKTDFWNLVDDLDKNPISVTAPLLTGERLTETVDGSDLVGVTVALLKTTSLIDTVPESIYQIKAGDDSTFVAMQSSLPYEFEGINIGLYISVMCHEAVLATTPGDLQAAMDSQHDIGRYFRLPFFGDAQTLFNTCKVWGSTPPYPGENDPVVSDIPTLVIEGKYDPATPPAFGKQVAANLSHSYYMEFPNQGHTPTATDTSGCAFDTMLAFFDNPDQSPDMSCLANIKGVNFIVPYTGNPPLKLEKVDSTTYSALMPTEWENSYPGFYRRGNSDLDITQVAAFSTFLDTSELLRSLSSKLYGYGGFDAAPVQSGVRHANGLDWALYSTTSYGRPVELAMADSPNRGAYVVILFCHGDERTALYQTVFLPIIDSLEPK
ncbi:MAG TPA: alpha/beta fold hydrolase [Anaerolineales bacterium]|nr:alpha/beta fold hydrolase [Anaerolineales bacterium]